MHTGKLISRLALRNLRRNRKRTALSASGLAIGLMVMLLAYGLLDGMADQSVESIITYESAHLRIWPEGYLEEDLPGLEYRIENPDSLRRIWAERGEAATVRLLIEGRLIAGREEAFVTVVGTDREHDSEVLETLAALTQGRGLEQPDEAILGHRLARDMGIELGDEIRLLVRSGPGAMNTRRLRVVGLINTGNPMPDSRSVFISLNDARQLALMPGGGNEIAVRFSSREMALEAAREWAGESSGVELETWREAASDVLNLVNLRRIVFGFVMAILGLIAIVAVSNTMVMAVHERTQEIGALRALGFSSSLIGRIFLAEGVAIGVGAGLLGVAGGVGLLLWLGVNGFDMSAYQDVDTGIPINTAIYPAIKPLTVALIFFAGVLMTALASWGAARRAARGQVVRALREGML